MGLLGFLFFFFLGLCNSASQSLKIPHQGLNPGLLTGKAQSPNLTTGLPGNSESILLNYNYQPRKITR